MRPHNITHTAQLFTFTLSTSCPGDTTLCLALVLRRHTPSRDDVISCRVIRVASRDVASEDDVRVSRCDRCSVAASSSLWTVAKEESLSAGEGGEGAGESRVGASSICKQRVLFSV